MEKNRRTRLIIFIESTFERCHILDDIYTQTDERLSHQKLAIMLERVRCKTKLIRSNERANIVHWPKNGSR